MRYKSCCWPFEVTEHVRSVQFLSIMNWKCSFVDFCFFLLHCNFTWATIKNTWHNLCNISWGNVQKVCSAPGPYPLGWIREDSFSSTLALFIYWIFCPHKGAKVKNSLTKPARMFNHNVNLTLGPHSNCFAYWFPREAVDVLCLWGFKASLDGTSSNLIKFCHDHGRRSGTRWSLKVPSTPMLSMILLFYVSEKESRPIYLLPPNPYSAKFIFISLSPEVNGPAKAACVGLTRLQQSK